MSASAIQLNRDETRAVVLTHLRDAAAAHGIHEAIVLGGRHDVEWPEWYADHMVDSLGAEGYEIFRRP